MLCLPIESRDHRNDKLIVILDSDNLIRMGQADPCAVNCKDLGKKLVNPKLIICHEKMTPEFMALLKCGDLEKIGKFLERGFQFRPDLGDHDGKPEKLK